MVNDGLEVLGTDEYKPDGGMYCGAFEGSGVRKVKLPSTLKRLEYSALEKCESLRRARLPEGLEHIGRRCFANCGLEEVMFPSSVKIIGYGAFLGCN